MNRRGIIPECAIEISTDLSGIVIHPKSVIQNLNHLLDTLSDQGVIIGLYVKEAFSNSNEARFYVGNFRLVPRPITLQSPRYLLPKPAALFLHLPNAPILCCAAFRNKLVQIALACLKRRFRELALK